MVFDLSLILSNTISGIIIQLPLFILLWLGFRLIAREIKIGVKNAPKWIHDYFKLQREQIAIERAIGLK